MGNLTLAAQKPDDEPFLFEVFAAARPYGGAEWGLAPEPTAILMRIQFEAQQAGYRAQFPSADYSVIQRDLAPVGSMVVDRPGGELRLVDVALLPQFRGQGIGRQLLNALQAEARAMELPFRLVVAKGNRAISLYGRAGFRLTADEGTHFALEWTPEAPTVPPPARQPLFSA